MDWWIVVAFVVGVINGVGLTLYVYVGHFRSERLDIIDSFACGYEEGLNEGYEAALQEARW